MLEQYKKEINKSGRSLDLFREFKDNIMGYNINVSNEELFIGYYRAMQLWLFENKRIENAVLRTAVKIGKVRTIKIIQKVIGVKKDGVFGPITRANLTNFKLEDFERETYKLKYQIISFIRLWK